MLPTQPARRSSLVGSVKRTSPARIGALDNGEGGLSSHRWR